LKLFEHEAKKIFRDNGIPVPNGVVIDSINFPTENLTYPVVVKSQVLVGGRGKAGGIRFASNEDECRQVVRDLLGMEIKGEVVNTLLIEEKLDIETELYISVIVDRNSRKHLVMASTEGGVDIEEVAEKNPEKIVKYHINPLEGFYPYMALEVARGMGLHGKIATKVAGVIYKLYQVYRKYDCEIAEINPLVITENGEVLAADAKVIVDDDAMFRHPEFSSIVRREGTALEQEAKELDLNYVDLDGSIAVLGNGAGLVLTLVDLITLYGGKPANFLDTGGGVREETVLSAMKILSKKCKSPEVKVMLINLDLAISSAAVASEGIVKGLSMYPIDVPIFARVIGNEAEKARETLKNAGIQVYEDIVELINSAIEEATQYEHISG
jgi:succinyl-CoA synthetase beta subunit